MNIQDLVDRLRDYPNNVYAGSPLLAEAAKALEYLDIEGVHSCHPHCDNWACVMRRENESLKAELAAEREKEREACAKVCDETTVSWTQHTYNSACNDCAAAIRARGEK